MKSKDWCGRCQEKVDGDWDHPSINLNGHFKCPKCGSIRDANPWY